MLFLPQKRSAKIRHKFGTFKNITYLRGIILQSTFITKTQQMASKKDRSKKKDNFKKKAKHEAAQKAIPRTHLVPVPNWQSDENLDLRGDYMEAIQQSVFEAYQHLERIGQALQIVLSLNVQVGKVKIDYVWNNGEKASEAEVEAFKKQMDEVKKQQELFAEQAKLQKNHSKTGLVGADGQPIATTQDLEEDSDSDEQPSNDAEDQTAEE